jgi:uncharacterized protein YndB with AHSA1/START domain
MHAIKHLFHINAKRSEVYKALTSVEELQKWWTVETTGLATKNGTLQFRFGNSGGPDFRVTELMPEEKAVWECTGSPHGWKGTTITFFLDDNEGKTRVRFSHEGWKEQDDFYAICSFTWGRYMESLRQLCETGTGAPFGAQKSKTN